MPIDGLTSASEPTNTHRKPTANRWTYVGLQPEKEKQLTQIKQKGERGARMPITGLTSASELNTHKECGDTKG